MRYEIGEIILQPNAAGLTRVVDGTVTVRDLRGRPLTVYSSETGTGQLANPLTVVGGPIEGYVEAADFDLEVDGDFNAYTQRIRQSPLGWYDALSYGVTADGVTDDTDAWNDLISLLPDGAFVTWSGLSVVQPGIHFWSRVAVVGQGHLRSAFKIAGGDDTDDGIWFGGDDGLRFGHIARDFSIVGGASCCANALVLENLITPEINNIWIDAGATAYGAVVKGMQNGKSISITVSNNTTLAYAGTAPQNGIRVIGSGLIPTNANAFRFVTDALLGDGIVGDGSVGIAGSNNNCLSGVSQGNGGKNVSLKQWTDFTVRDLHSEASTGTELYLEACQRGQLGSGLFVDGLTHLVDCDDINLDGITTTALTVDAACTGIKRGRFFLNGGADSDSHTLPTVASAATVTFPPCDDTIKVTGVTTITSITASWPDRKVTLIWAAGATFDVTDGSNLKLGSSITTHDADDTLSLVSDGTNWHETGRSVV